VLYGATPFHFETLTRLHAFMARLTPSLRAMVKSLHLEINWAGVPTPQELLVKDHMSLLSREIISLTGLRHLRMTFKSRHWRSPEVGIHCPPELTPEFMERLRELAAAKKALDFVVTTWSKETRLS